MGLIACMALTGFAALAGNGERRLGLQDFSVAQNGRKTDIKWSLNNPPLGDHFTIEKSIDGKHFTKLIDMPVSESGNPYEEYYESDYQPASGVTFYRICQADEAGHLYYSETLCLKYNTGQAYRFNPTLRKRKQAAAEESHTEKKPGLFVLRDADGNDYYALLDLKKENGQLWVAASEPIMPAGVYRIIGTSKNELLDERLNIR